MIARARWMPIVLVAGLAGCHRSPERQPDHIVKPSHRVPNPTRTTPPPGIGSRALAVGAVAPAVSLPQASGGTWTLDGGLAEQTRAMLVFYRGSW